MRSTSVIRSAVCLALVGAWSVTGVAQSPPAEALEPVNPVVDDPADPANTGFLVFVEDDVTLNEDESEGTIAMGGDLLLGPDNYQVALQPPVVPTYTAPGDSAQTYLHVGGGVRWSPAGSPVISVLSGGFTKIGDPDTYDAYNTNPADGSSQNTRIVPQGAGYTSPTYIQNTTTAQTPASVGEPADLDFAGSFATYRGLSTEIGQCAETVTVTNANGDTLPRPLTGGQAYVTLTAGRTNVINLTGAELDAIDELNFSRGPRPSAATPVVVNVSGTTFSGTMPNQPPLARGDAPYVLYNFPQATSVTFAPASASVEGTLYAPRATLNWVPGANIEGNVIASTFVHGDPLVRDSGPLREIHDAAFATTIECATAPVPSAELTLVKQVVNDDGGTAAPGGDFELEADGPVDVEGETGTTDVTDVTVPPGDYDLSETGPAGYDTDGWTCVGSTVSAGTVNLDDGDDVTCTIVNDDVPSGPGPSPSPELTLVKEVVNDDGGTAAPGDFTLAAEGPTPVEGVTGDAAVTDATVGAGEYDLSEAGPTDDYDPSAWTCTAGTLDGDVLTLAAGDDATCTIVNDDVAPDGTGGFDDVTDDGAPEGTGAGAVPSATCPMPARPPDWVSSRWPWRASRPVPRCSSAPADGPEQHEGALRRHGDECTTVAACVSLSGPCPSSSSPGSPWAS